MTSSDPPPTSSERVARLRAALARAADKPEAKTRPGVPAAENTPIAVKPGPSPEPARTRGDRPGAITSERAATARQQQRSAVPGADEVRRSGSERPANGTDQARPAAAGVRRRAASEPPMTRPASSADEPSSARATVPYSREVERTVPGAVEPYPPLSDRLVNGIGTAPMDANNPKRITPRSPRTALEPDMIEMPTRRSRSARHPFVVVGNAIISIFVLLAIVGGFALVVGKERFEAPGPLPQDRIVNIPRGTRTPESPALSWNITGAGP